MVSGARVDEDVPVIGLSLSRRVYAYGAAVDMRKGHDGLSAIVREGLGRDPLSGDLYLFVSRNRIRAKVLLWDGRFACLWRAQAGEALTLSASELQLFLEGCELVGRVPLSPSPLSEINLVISRERCRCCTGSCKRPIASWRR
jgi:transposase